LLENEQVLQPPVLRRFWQNICGSLPVNRPRQPEVEIDLLRRIRKDGWSPGTRLEVIAALDPGVRLGPAFSGSFLEEEGEPLRMYQLASVECELNSEAPYHFVIEPLHKLPEWLDILVDLALDVANLLRRAVDLQAAFDSASPDHDWSYMHRPLIMAPDDDDIREFDGWELLIELNREAIDVLLQRDKGRWAQLLAFWCDQPYPVFRRLYLYGVQGGDRTEALKLLGLLTSSPKHWLWSYHVEDQLLAIIPWLHGHLSEAERQCLIDGILAGPSRADYDQDLTPEEWAELCDRLVRKRLERLQREGPLPDQARERLELIESAHPDRIAPEVTDEERRQPAAVWGELPGVADYSEDDLAVMHDDELLDVIRQHQEHRAGLVAVWQGLLRRDPQRTLALMRRLTATDPADMWQAGLEVLREQATEASLAEPTLAVLEAASPEVSEDNARTVAAILRAIAMNLAGPAYSERLLAVWDRMEPGAFGD